MQKLIYAGTEVTYLRPYSKPGIHSGRNYPGYAEIAMVRPCLYDASDASVAVHRVRNDCIRIVHTL